MRCFTLALGILAATACGHVPSRRGITLDEMGITKSIVGPVPAGAFDGRFMAGTTRAMKRADVIGDERLEQLVETGLGKGVDILDDSGQLLRRVPTNEYLTDFGTVSV